ncbi:sensor domain-containing protein [Sulfuricystis multivorans]|uniref:sensor domain-containing protein n=1 Tax=Sulfuricystis multivorans TaxID=2211108 RepID=UPI000F83B6E8|nr:EAL domain-containing protein [Sulfuricystis multivorans]
MAELENPFPLPAIPNPEQARALCAAARAVPGACQLAGQVEVLDQVHESIITMDLSGHITGWNKMAEKMFGYTAEEAIGKHILFLYADPDAEEDVEFREAAFLGENGHEMEVRRRRKSGEVFWASLQLSLAHDENGQPVGIVGYLSDITARIETEKTLRLHARIFEFSQESILITGPDRRILSANPAFTKMTGYTEEEVIGRLPTLLRSARHPLHFYEELWRCVDETGSWHGEIWTRRKNGEDFPSWASISLVRNRDGRICNYFSIFADITERKAAEERIHHLAYYDSLTGLPNRALLHRLLEQSLAAARRYRRSGALLFIDLNRFKPINDSLGHAAGDRLLQQVAERLRATVRTEDVVARLGGDEFVVALFDIARREHAARVAQKVIEALEPPFHIEGHTLRVGAAIGISIFPRDGNTPETLLRMADIAMYRCKETGQTGYMFFSREMNRHALERLRLESGLRQGIARNELRLLYQPKIDVATGRIAGAEALVRWQNPDLGMLPPDAFIPIAEETDLITDLTGWVLDAALQQMRAWGEAGLTPLRIAINLSARDFQPGLAERLQALLERHRVAAEQVQLEITESLLTQRNALVIELIEQLDALGVSLALDDFGTGYSSLSYLKRFPIDTLKIDRSFVKGIPDDENDCAIARAIISLAHSLDLHVVAEGVETRMQLEFLSRLGCQEIQGYHFSPPVPPATFEEMLKAGLTLPAR